MIFLLAYLRMSSNTQKLNTVYQKYNIPYPLFKYNICDRKFICSFRLPNKSVVYSDPKDSKKLAKEAAIELVLSDITKILEAVRAPKFNTFPKFTGLVIVDGDNITKSDQIELLISMEKSGMNIMLVVASTYDMSKISGKFKKIIVVENVGKQAVDIWIVAYVAKYDFSYGQELVIISADHFASTLSNLAQLFHSRPIKISSYNSVTTFITA